MSEPLGVGRVRRAQAHAEAIRARRALARATGAREVRPGYAGLVTRTIAFAADGAVVNGVAAIVASTVALCLSVLHMPSDVERVIAAIGAGVWLLWSVGYFAFFWSSTGQTPGDRLMRIRVRDARDRGPIRPLRAALRFGFLLIALLPLGAGLLMMVFDERSRGLHDRLARTVVVFAAEPAPEWQGR